MLTLENAKLISKIEKYNEILSSEIENASLVEQINNVSDLNSEL